MDKTSYSCPSDFEHQKLPFYIMSSELSNGTSKRIRFLVFVFLLHALFWCFFCSFLRAFFLYVFVFSTHSFFSFVLFVRQWGSPTPGERVAKFDGGMSRYFISFTVVWIEVLFLAVLAEPGWITNSSSSDTTIFLWSGHLAGLIGSADDLSSVPGRLVLLYPHFIFALYLGRVELLSYAVWCITPDANLVLFNCST